ncbi:MULTISPECIES: hypothetical protein [unclassified Pseudoclavibacter]|uniref:hypothetical protein n=1 Tax=unclassified Pseudoclavibacter TaxID=2615177 RepID=UPI001BA9BE27|nr:hypothetical protein [Pseudoclavibacter sp. Marseille-Q4354]MBS3179907.1 hypothetical protein [Pseudoclavibacter sp. Marseille-Q4354]
MVRIKHRPRSKWGVAAAAVFFLGAAIPIFVENRVMEREPSEAALRAALTTWLALGLLLGGAGQLIRVAAHGATSVAGEAADGAGKITGLFGWSPWLIGAVMFAFEGTETSEALLLALIVSVYLLFFGTLGAALLPRKSQPD